MLDRSRKWKKENKERHAELARAYRRRNAEKVLAQNRLNYAVRKGLIKRLPCEGCGTDVRVHAHHHDYSKPYEVRWLCFQCHKDAHPVSDEDKAVKFSGATKGRLHGEESPVSKLTDKQVHEIRAMLDAGISQNKIANFHGIGQSQVSRIKLGKSRTRS